MKKKKMIWIIVTVIVAAVCIGFMAISSLDKIVSTEVKEIQLGDISGRKFIAHTFKNGKTVDVGVGWDLIALADNVHIVSIHIQKDMERSSDGVQLSNASYDLRNISFSAHIEDENGGFVLCMLSKADGSQGTQAAAYTDSDLYSRSKRTLCGAADEDYIYAQYVIKGKFELVDLDISYDLIGKGTRLGSRFEEQKTTIDIGQKTLVYDNRPVEE